jgi:hypothetical protein
MKGLLGILFVSLFTVSLAGCCNPHHSGHHKHHHHEHSKVHHEHGDK